MLIDGVIEHFPTATVEMDTPFYRGHAKVLCMDNPVYEVIIGNITGSLRLRLRQHGHNNTNVTGQCTYLLLNRTRSTR